MNRKEAIIRVSARIPRWLRILRARLLLEDHAEHMGMREAECSACEGCGWLDTERLELCPACHGFRKVPRTLAEWVGRELFKEQAREEVRSFPRSHPEPEPEGPRYGRCAEEFHKVSESDMCDSGAPESCNGLGS